MVEEMMDHREAHWPWPAASAPERLHRFVDGSSLVARREGVEPPTLLIRRQRLFFSISINETSGPVSCIT